MTRPCSSPEQKPWGFSAQLHPIPSGTFAVPLVLDPNLPGRVSAGHGMAKEHLTLRVPSEVMREIAREAARSGRPVTTLAADLLEEGLVMPAYPGIGFREGATW